MKIAIIGAGLTGLTAGYELSKKGHQITVYEQEDSPGGLAGSFDMNGEPLDKFYHHIFTNDTYLLDLLKELGAEDDLKWYEPKNAIYMDSRFFPFTTPLDLLRFTPLHFINRIRMGLLVFWAKFIKSWQSIEDITARDWIIKRAGKDAYTKVWGPLLHSKFDVDSNTISATWIWNKFKLRGSSRGKNISKEQLGYMQGSFSRISVLLVEKILERGGQVLFSSKVDELQPNLDNTVTVISEHLGHSENLEHLEHSEHPGHSAHSDHSEHSDHSVHSGHSHHTKEIYDRVIFTAAPELLLKACPFFGQDYRDALHKIKYKANICMVLELCCSLSDYYWMTVAQEEIPFVLMIEHTNLIQDGRYKNHIVYLSRYLDMENPLYAASDETIEALFIESLQKMFPSLKKDHILSTAIHRARYSQPVFKTGYSAIIPDIKTPIEQIHLSSMCQIYPEDRGQNYAIRLGKEIAKE